MEHIEQAGVHSGDSACSLPPFSLSPAAAGRAAPADGRDGARPRRRRPDERAVRDPVSEGSDGEASSTCSRSIRARRAPCRTCRRRPAGRWPRSPRAAWSASRWRARASRGEIVPPYFSVKEAVFPFIKFPGVDTILGPEMKSTGEVMGVGESFAEAFVKSQLAAGVRLPEVGQGVPQRQEPRQAARDRSRAHPGRARLHARRHARAPRRRSRLRACR